MNVEQTTQVPYEKGPYPFVTKRHNVNRDKRIIYRSRDHCRGAVRQGKTRLHWTNRAVVNTTVAQTGW